MLEVESQVIEIIGKGIDALNRLSEGIERLVDEPMVEVESTPPKCPHCNILYPTIIVAPTEQLIGPIDEFILVCNCDNCGKEIFGIVTGWMIQGDKGSAISNAKQIAERNGNG